MMAVNLDFSAGYCRVFDSESGQEIKDILAITTDIQAGSFSTATITVPIATGKDAKNNEPS